MQCTWLRKISPKPLTKHINTCMNDTSTISMNCKIAEIAPVLMHVTVEIRKDPTFPTQLRICLFQSDFHIPMSFPKDT